MKIYTQKEVVIMGKSNFDGSKLKWVRHYEANKLQAENDRLRKAFLHFAECVNSVKKNNTPEWMEYIQEEINKVEKALFTTEEE